MTADLRDLYQEIILDHNKSPHNFGEMKEYTRKIEGFNPLCGDRYMFYLKIRGDVLEEISFTGHGCAISKSSASILTDSLKGESIGEVKNIITDFMNLMKGAEPAARPNRKLSKAAALQGVCAYPMRIKCATLSWHTVKSGLEGKEKVEVADA